MGNIIAAAIFTTVFSVIGLLFGEKWSYFQYVTIYQLIYISAMVKDVLKKGE